MGVQYRRQAGEQIRGSRSRHDGIVALPALAGRT
jgi:hypothetical protein